MLTDRILFIISQTKTLLLIDFNTSLAVPKVKQAHGDLTKLIEYLNKSVSKPGIVSCVADCSIEDCAVCQGCIH